MSAQPWRCAPPIYPPSHTLHPGPMFRGGGWGLWRSGLGLAVGGDDLAETALGALPRGSRVSQRHAHATAAFGASAGEIGKGGGVALGLPIEAG